jgi:uncharacterized protein
MSIVGIGLASGGYLLMRAPRCSKCRVKMILMGEQEDDAHLTPVERTEEKIGAVDHEVWLCSQCGEIRKKNWSAALGHFSRCEECGAKAVDSSVRIVEAPTYSHAGQRRVDTECAHCGHKSSYTTMIPRLEERRYEPSRSSSSSRSYRSHSSSSSSSGSSSSRSSGFGGGSSSSGGSSSGSSSSSGYSGGSSSGGGASGKW